MSRENLCCDILRVLRLARANYYPERSVAGFGASLTLLASCKVLLNLSAIRHFDDP